ncbi:hypothetical protein S245_013737 [Arachis hypogaea]|nr:uncharacterized protein DS421_4g129950 [Arachis hypogaea]
MQYMQRSADKEKGPIDISWPLNTNTNTRSLNTKSRMDYKQAYEPTKTNLPTINEGELYGEVSEEGLITQLGVNAARNKNNGELIWAPRNSETKGVRKLKRTPLKQGTSIMWS